MARRIWIISSNKKPEGARAAAIANNCPEIARGIPPALVVKVNESGLPCVFEEIEPIAPEPPIDLISKIDELESRVEKLEVENAKLALQ